MPVIILMPGTVHRKVGACLCLHTLLRRGGAARGTTFAFVFGGFDFLCGGVLTEIVDWKHIADWDLSAIPRSATTLQPLTEKPHHHHHPRWAACDGTFFLGCFSHSFVFCLHLAFPHELGFTLMLDVRLSNDGIGSSICILFSLVLRSSGCPCS